PPPLTAVLFVKIERFTTRLLSPAKISIAPPKFGDFPLRNVRSLSVTGVLTPMFCPMNRMRKSGVPLSLDRSMIVLPAAAPLTVIGLPTSGRPPGSVPPRKWSAAANVYVPAGMLIVSTPPLEPAAHSPAAPPEAAFVLAALIASISVQAPSVALVTILMVL